MNTDAIGTAVRKALTDSGLDRILIGLTEALAAHDRVQHGDLNRWREALADMPVRSGVAIDLNLAAPRIPMPDITQEEDASLLHALRALMPWRKGPFEIGGHLIDAEWRSDWKWDRLLPNLRDLSGRHVLDVGCGNGYFCLRAAGAGCASAIGIDPLPLYVMQFRALARYVGSLPVCVLPLASEDLGALPPLFDTVLSMGVLYHRRSPLEHLGELKRLLRPGGELALETLIVPGGSDTVLVPLGRYARMRNVWFIPSVAAIEVWLRRLGFQDVRCVDQTRTTAEEQRSTPWMEFESLASALDPARAGRTIEGYPGPTRAIFIASKPA